MDRLAFGDPEPAAREYGARFRTDVGASLESSSRSTCVGCDDLPTRSRRIRSEGLSAQGTRRMVRSLWWPCGIQQGPSRIRWAGHGGRWSTGCSSRRAVNAALISWSRDTAQFLASSAAIPFPELRVSGFRVQTAFRRHASTFFNGLLGQPGRHGSARGAVERMRAIWGCGTRAANSRRGLLNS